MPSLDTFQKSNIIVSFLTFSQPSSYSVNILMALSYLSYLSLQIVFSKHKYFQCYFSFVLICVNCIVFQAIIKSCKLHCFRIFSNFYFSKFITHHANFSSIFIFNLIKQLRVIFKSLGQISLQAMLSAFFYLVYFTEEILDDFCRSRK